MKEETTVKFNTPMGEIDFDAAQLLLALHDGAVEKEEKPSNEISDSREFFTGEKPSSISRYWKYTRAGIWFYSLDQLLEERFEVQKVERYNNQGERGAPLLYNDFNIAYDEKASLLIAGDKYVIDKKTDSNYILSYRIDNDGDFRLVVWFNPLTNAPGDFWEILEEHFYSFGPLKAAVFEPSWSFLPRVSDEAKMLVLEPEVVSKIDQHLYKWMDRVESYRDRGLSTSRGIILAGPPGVGKTLFVKSLVEKTTDHTTIVVSADDINCSGDIKEVFMLARKLAPSLIVLEDAEFCGIDRSYRYSSMIGEILQAMDGMNPNKGVITIATTNLIETLDPAIRDRPGRFDHVIQIGPPSLKTRQQLLETYAVKFNIDPKVSMSQVAQSTEGFTGAFLKELLVNAELRSKDGTITIGDFQDANDDISHGRDWANTPTHLTSKKKSDSNSYV